MIVDYKNILASIQIKQAKELSYKGTLNRELYLFGYDINGNVLMESYWKDKNKSFMESFIETAINNTNVVKVSVSNKYHDWFVDIYTR